MLAEVTSLKDVYALFSKLSPKEVIEMLEAEGLLLKLNRCSKCRTQRTLNKNKDYKGGYAFYCKKCKKFKNVTDGTFFDTTKIEFEDFFVLLWLWASHTSVKVARNLTNFSKVTIIQYFRYFRDICSWKLLTLETQTLGGEGNTVQIDESVVAKRKYIRGKRVKTTWVLGMIDEQTRQSVILYVEKRDSATMIPEIQRHVKPGTTIWTDCWKAYNGLSRVGYKHETVNHSKNFKSPTGVCTNLIEGHWNKLKKHCRTKNVMNSKFFFEYVDEFMWIEKYGPDAYSKRYNMIQQIKEKYPC
ncbi:uncharacterized protein LOC117643053 [Thrips palmi]|uniref:Uncharacterized protein LOC117643053 n=1 Tax=Thrips palmi TaxID=161013 RepID=A0A6P8YD42_THRPL|nr:uncharacterized protein LOC117643053 [Thrips palmi]